QNIRDIKEQAVYLGSIPLMTKAGVFVINGTERVIVSQLQRSPGLFYTHDGGKTHSLGKFLYSARIIPVRGSWIDLEFDAKDILYVRIDRRRKFPVTTLLKALGYNAEELLRIFYNIEKVLIDGQKFRKTFDPELAIGKRATFDLIHPETGDLLAKKNRKIGKALAKRLVAAGITELEIKLDELIGAYIAHDIINTETGEVLLLCNGELTEEILESMVEAKIPSFEILFIDGINVTDSFRKTLALDKVDTTEDALIEIYRRLRPSSPPTIEVASTFFNNLFFNSDTYDLSVVGRFKINAKLGVDTDIAQRTLTKDDIVLAVRYLARLKDAQGPIDDIDHLGN
ncbi:MAG: DNA-directed RNA polymerase subunit beta, partial [Desulfobulbaceae bacterium]|nr:DNA-directed RNA polymerase subunit beta [Desulfobulbaceae bacterium]